ncbi:hypothetical protein L1987_15383 [Smallanthus sonchifolius]|uniref:Uncharacterized protein n=1 Tax=Smallanthus sonchifolius TaxID=185202 RepID=A0ACB9J684_9ASTR|nr:hypothetical protein L1987_15383 [Smallanthus sonchifolius]
MNTYNENFTGEEFFNFDNNFSYSWCELCGGSHYIEECYLSIWRPMDHEINHHPSPFEDLLPSPPPSVNTDSAYYEPDPWKPDTLFRNLEEIKSQIIKLYVAEPNEDPSEILDHPPCVQVNQASQEQVVEVITMIPMGNTENTSEDDLLRAEIIQETLEPPRLKNSSNAFSLY